ncbi:septum formation initiator family protein [Parasutterella secunda]|jgi:cell division protein ftsB homolog|uniref:septum formation initiator family protein n=1 Tax=Parasutterella secunda TaxID=626947 RepID=UPI00033FE9DF|nr:septum formation initiator family protein [Parasutterella secunda]CDE75334.1 cell division protein FtsB [Sutterella sp. CAG:521]HIR21711.1 septum formation initiator family protein [Candidatus Aphodousia faecalis]HJI93974.1 septum formation initiator family protein [Sutterellaceae bacterium]MCL1596634.1 septum formation initiator family protein [Parasutterella secunda]MCR8920701.1 septum formation initiator family protein [Parasutterella secunda]
MITPDKIIKVLLILLLLMLWPLIGGQGGYIRVVSLSEELADIKEQNALTFEENQRLAAEVRSLVRGADAIEERARYDLNMVRPGEVLFRIQRPQKVLPGNAIPADILNDPLYRPAPVTPPAKEGEK